MPILPRVRGVVLSLAGRGPVQRELDAEVNACFEMLVDEKVAAGVDAKEARRQAQLEMGGVEQVKEEVRGGRPAALLDTILRDIRYSVRLLAKTPAFSLAAILVLALGIGANTAVFSVINVLCFRPLPGSEQPGQALRVYARNPARPDSYHGLSYAHYEAVRSQANLFSDVMAYRTTQVGVNDGDTSRRARAVLATRSYFATLGVGLAAGRAFSPEEERPGSAAAVMVVSHPFWERLGRPSDILGKTIVVNAQPFTVVGRAPEGFSGTTAIAGPEFWLPLGAAPLLTPRSADAASGGASSAALSLMVVARLRPAWSMGMANDAVRRLSGALAPAEDGSGHELSLGPVSRYNQSTAPDEGDDGLFLALAALEGAAFIVLIIASLNVANMQLARGTSRRKEIAMRLALGAGRARIVGQLMIEGLVLAAAGGALGLVASVWTLHALIASFTPVVPGAVSADGSMDWRVALAAAGFCTVSALAFSLGPSLKLSRLDLVSEMKSQEGSGAGRGLRRLGARNLLVAGQVALSLALLAASGLFVRGAIAAGAAEPGYSFDRQFRVKLDAATGGLDEAAARVAYQRVIENLRATPGVESVAAASYVALANESSTRRVWRPGTVAVEGQGGRRGVNVLTFDVGAGYFATLRLPLLRGREFTRGEDLDPAATRVAIIDEPLAALLFPGQDPVGQFVEMAGGGTAPEPPVQVVGLARGVRHRLGDVRPVPHIYLPLGPHYQSLLNIHVRTVAGRGVSDMRSALHQSVRRADTRLGVLAVQTLAEARDSMPLNWIVGTAARAFGGLGLIALFMATIGLYGVKAYLVARRTREIGIRMALGASARSVVRMVLREGASLLAVSIAIGFLLAVALGQVVSSLLVGVRPFDPLVLSIATLVLSGAVLAACYVPARRATRISPMRALRVE